MRRPWLLLLHHQLTVVCYTNRPSIGQLLSPLANENTPIFSLDQSQWAKGTCCHWLTSQFIDQSRVSLKSDSRIHHFLKKGKRKIRVMILIGISMSSMTSWFTSQALLVFFYDANCSNISHIVFCVMWEYKSCFAIFIVFFRTKGRSTWESLSSRENA